MPMISIWHAVALLAITMLPAGLFTGCSHDTIAGGSGSTTTNGFTAVIVNNQGEPVRNATVHIRPHDYCAGSSELSAPAVAGTIADTFTSADGTISRGNMHPDSYTIEIIDESTQMAAVIRSEISAGPVQKLGGVTLAPAGTIRGALDAALLGGSATFGIQIYGMERLARIDPATGTFTFENMPAAEYTLRLAGSGTAFTPVDIDTVSVLPQQTATVNPYASWQHAATMSIDTRAAGLSATDTLYNFPMLLRLGADNFDFSTAKRKGNDFRITKSNGSAVPFEQEWWDSASGTAALWVLIDTLGGSNEVQTVNLYWGNTNASLVSRPATVFDTATGFSGVWHLNESGGTPQKDATAFGNDGTPQRQDGSNDVPGIIGRSQQFKNDSQCIVFSSINSLPGNGNSDWTVSLWVKSLKTDTAAYTFFDDRGSGCTLLLDTASRWVLHGSTGSSITDSCSAPATPGIWVYICGSRKGSSMYLYVNGTIADSAAAATVPPSATTSGKSFRLGSQMSDTGWFYGVIDELRSSRQAESDLWIRLCYTTQRENQDVVRIVPQPAP